MIAGYFDDDGSEMYADWAPKPGLCVTCRKDNAGGKEEMLCIRNCNDQKDDTDFECGAYEPKQ